MTKYALKFRVMFIFLSTFIFFVSNMCFCADEETLTPITYGQYDVMKMGMSLTVERINKNATDTEKSLCIQNHFMSQLETNQQLKFAQFHYREDIVFQHIKNLDILSSVRESLLKLWVDKGYAMTKFSIEPIAPISTTAQSNSSLQTIYIYKDEGVSELSANVCKEAILASNFKDYNVELIDAEQTIRGDWRHNAVAFLIPGGTDIDYCRKLNGPGNTQIKQYVENGGTYIGFCAGAYYGSRVCAFTMNSENPILDFRELGFFPGVAKGPVLAPYSPMSKAGVRIAKIKTTQDVCNVYFNGGCYFEEATQYPNVHVLACYCNEGFEELPAVIECTVGNGKALLSGVHFEVSAENLRQLESCVSSDDWRYLNGNIIPELDDKSHTILFRIFMERI